MKSKSTVVLIYAILILFASSSLIAQETSQSLTLENAVQLAIENSPDLKTARLETQKASARVSEAWGYTMPALDFSGQYTNAIKKPVFFLPGIFFGKPPSVSVPVEIGSTHSLSLGLTARQILFNGAVFVGVGASGIYSEAAQELYRGKRVETVSKVRKAFYSVLLAKEALQLTRTSMKNAEDNLKNVRVMRSQGILSEYDELRATVGVENIRPMVMQMETNFDLATSALGNIIGVPITPGAEVVGALTFTPYDENLLANAEQRLLESNSNLHALRLQKDVNQAFVNAERSNYLPTIAAFGNFQYQGQKNTFDFGSSDLIKSSLVGISISYNLFQGLQTNAKVDQAKLEVMKTETQLINIQNSLRTALRATIGTLRQARKRIEVQEKTVETAERGYKIATTRFLSNAATQLEVNDAQLALTQAKVNRMQAIYDYLVASADLDQLLNQLPACASEKN